MSLPLRPWPLNDEQKAEFIEQFGEDALDEFLDAALKDGMMATNTEEDRDAHAAASSES